MNDRKIFSWENIDAEALPGSKVRSKVVNGDNMQLVWAEFQPGTPYPLHSHTDREQFSFMISGRMKMTVGDETREIGPGEMWHAAVNVVHGGEVIGDEPVVFVDIYSPPSQDMIDRIEGARAERLKSS